MPLVNLKDILERAKNKSYAVGSFNAVNLDFANSVIRAAHQKKSPVILSLAEAHFRYFDFEQITPVLVSSCKRASVPVTLFLDHGESPETAFRAVDLGFTGVMIDLSKLDFEENIRLSCKVVEYAHKKGVSVEAEIGVIGGGGESNYSESIANPAFFTDYKQALEFIKRTGVDALAVSVGNVHGFYKGEPKLNFSLIKKLGQTIPVPLVLHGGSGISDNDFRKAISLGISKINYFTGMSKTAIDRVRQEMKSGSKFIGYEELNYRACLSVTDSVANKMAVFGSSGMAE